MLPFRYTIHIRYAELFSISISISISGALYLALLICGKILGPKPQVQRERCGTDCGQFRACTSVPIGPFTVRSETLQMLQVLQVLLTVALQILIEVSMECLEQTLF